MTAEMPRRFGTFFLPGPTEVRPEILQAMLRPMISHRGREFEEIFARCQDGLRLVFRTARPIIISSSSATGLMEAAVRCAPPGAILSLVNGAFSERFAQIGVACGRDVTRVDVPLGASFEMESVRAALAAKKFAAMTVVHSESSTGVLTDVGAIAALARDAGVCCLVDSVTGLGGAPLSFDDEGYDLVLSGSQKSLALPPGLAFGAASERYMSKATQASSRGAYFDLAEFEAFAARNQTPNTPSVSLFFALDAQLENVRREGIEGRWKRHDAMRTEVERWVDGAESRINVPLRMLAAPGQRSPTVSAIVVPKGVPGASIVKGMKARGFVIGGGYGGLKDTTLRIGHMGDHTVDTVRACLAELDEVLESLEVGA